MSKTLKAFMVVMVAHWAEHLYQAYQVYGMHMPRNCAMGILGIWFPVLMTGEWLHFGFAILTFMFIAMTFDQFYGRARVWWNRALWFSTFHLMEHFGLFYQAQTGRYWFHRSVPTSVIQYFIPRIELHLFYNTIVTILVSVAMYYHFKRRKHEASAESCNRIDPDSSGNVNNAVVGTTTFNSCSNPTGCGKPLC